MLGRFRQSGDWTSLWAAVALFFVALRAVVPDGYMLAQSEEGGVSIVICSAQGTRQVSIDPETGQVIEDGADPFETEHQSLGDTCPFAMAAHAVFPLSPALAAVPAPAGPAHYIIPAQRSFAAAASPPLPARGPPHSA